MLIQQTRNLMLCGIEDKLQISSDISMYHNITHAGNPLPWYARMRPAEKLGKLLYRFSC